MATMPGKLDRIYRTDEELGKRDDNYRPRDPTPLDVLSVPTRWRHRRLLALLAFAGFAYLFIHNIPTDLGSIDQRIGRPLRPGHSVVRPVGGASDQSHLVPPEPRRAPSDRTRGQRSSRLALDPDVDEPAPPLPKISKPDPMVDTEDQSHHYYAGTIRYSKLSSTLSRVSRSTRFGSGESAANQNVLFAASSLRSAANLIPLACDMAGYGKSIVHFVIMGRAGLSIDAILKTNRVVTEDCNVHFHDGRPDYTQYSTDLRAKAAVQGAMKHVDAFLKPQVIITDDPFVEDAYFVEGLKDAALQANTPIIEIPYGHYGDLKWLSRIDAAGLSMMQKVQIDILINVHSGSAGGIIQLLKSLSEADYQGLPVPRLILDLPPDIDPFVDDFLRKYSWPPPNTLAQAPPNPRDGPRLIHRISTRVMTPKESSVRFFESFYPLRKDLNHVLLLSPKTELSPLYYHYLYYTVLKTRYASEPSPDTDLIFGIGLATPTTLLNGEDTLTIPEPVTEDAKTTQRAFQWQAPNADAILIFGDKWAEAHSYLSHRLKAFHNHKTGISSLAKQISAAQPAWLEYLLELMKARGWVVLYPGGRYDAKRSQGWATVHKELFKIPEEHRRIPVRPTTDANSESTISGSLKDPFLYGPDPKQQRPVRPRVEADKPLDASLALSELLPPIDEDQFDNIDAIAFLDTDGKQSSFSQAAKTAISFAVALRQAVGGCSTADAESSVARKRAKVGFADDLFCVGAGPEESVESAGGHIGTKSEQPAKDHVRAGTEPKIGQAKPAESSTNDETRLDAAAGDAADGEVKAAREDASPAKVNKEQAVAVAGAAGSAASISDARSVPKSDSKPIPDVQPGAKVERLTENDTDSAPGL